MAKADKLSLDVDDICRRIEGQESLRHIADSFGLDIAQLRRWIEADASRSARIREAREDSAFDADEMALQTLMDENIDVARAREIASHYRWRAKTRKPKVFGDRVEVDQKVSFEDHSDEQLHARFARLLTTSAEAGSLALAGGDRAASKA